MTDRNSAQMYPSIPLSTLPFLSPPPCYCSDSNFVCLRFCSGKYNQSISHWQIPIICNFMGDKPIQNQNDLLNVCMQLPNELILIFFFYLLSWNPADRFLFLKWNWVEKWEKNACEWESNNGRDKKVAFWHKGFCLEQKFLTYIHLILQHNFAQTFSFRTRCIY